jgi:hypothetical protein
MFAVKRLIPKGGGPSHEIVLAEKAGSGQGKEG